MKNIKEIVSIIRDPWQHSLESTKEDELYNPNNSTNFSYFQKKGEVNELKKLFHDLS